MAYLIFADRSAELARHELAGPVTIGRADGCSIVVRDIELSRRHCKVEPVIDQWVITDLGSKNGTRVDGRLVTRHTLEDGDVVRLGRIMMCFRAGAFVPPPPTDRPADVRPTDPREALAGTVAGFRIAPEPTVDTTHFPRPQPHPAETNAPSLVEAHSLVTGLSSSSWDELITRSGNPRQTALPRVSLNLPTKPPSRRMRINRLLALAGAVVTIVLLAILVVMHWTTGSGAS